MTYARVYSERLSGPQQVNTTAGVTLHCQVPSGHRYVIRVLHLAQTGGSGLVVARLVLVPVSGTSLPMLAIPVPVDSSVFPEVFLVLRAGEALHAYVTGVGINLTMTTGGYDLVDVD